MRECIDALVNAWSEETCVPSCRAEWKNSDSSYGQCAVTALVMNDIFGGKIMRCMSTTGSHYYNNIDGEDVDLTIAQFNDQRPNYQNGEERTREYLLSNEDTKKRYLTLLTNFYNNLCKYSLEEVDSDERIDKKSLREIADFTTFEIDTYEDKGDYEIVQFDLAAQNTGNIFCYKHLKENNQYILIDAPLVFTLKQDFTDIPDSILENIFAVARDNKESIRKLKK